MFDFTQVAGAESHNPEIGAESFEGHEPAFPPSQTPTLPPAKRDPFDMAKVKADLEPYRKAVESMAFQASKHQVTDDKSNGEAVGMAGQAKRLGKDIEDERKRIIKDPSQFVKSVNGLVKEFTAMLDEIEAGLKKKIGTYQYQQEMKRREAERKAQEEAAALQAKLDAEAKEKNIEAPKVIAPVAAAAPKVTRTDNGVSAHTRKVWKCEVTDESQVPRDFCVPSQTLLNEAVKKGVREIPGCRIFEDVQTVLRT